MKTLATSTDEELLLANTSDAFWEFYDRHARELMGYFARRARDPQAAADLTAETFASAIVAQRRFRPGRSPAIAWLFTIAARRLADYQRRGWVDERVRRSLAMERTPITEDDAVRCARRGGHLRPAGGPGSRSTTATTAATRTPTEHFELARRGPAAVRGPRRGRVHSLSGGRSVMLHELAFPQRTPDGN